MWPRSASSSRPAARAIAICSSNSLSATAARPRSSAQRPRTPPRQLAASASERGSVFVEQLREAVGGGAVVRFDREGERVGPGDQAPVRIGAGARGGFGRLDRVAHAIGGGTRVEVARLHQRLGAVDRGRRALAGIRLGGQLLQDRDRLVGAPDGREQARDVFGRLVGHLLVAEPFEVARGAAIALQAGAQITADRGQHAPRIRQQRLTFWKATGRFGQRREHGARVAEPLAQLRQAPDQRRSVAHHIGQPTVGARGGDRTAERRLGLLHVAERELNARVGGLGGTARRAGLRRDLLEARRGLRRFAGLAGDQQVVDLAVGRGLAEHERPDLAAAGVGGADRARARRHLEQDLRSALERLRSRGRQRAAVDREPPRTRAGPGSPDGERPVASHLAAGTDANDGAARPLDAGGGRGATPGRPAAVVAGRRQHQHRSDERTMSVSASPRPRCAMIIATCIRRPGHVSDTNPARRQARGSPAAPSVRDEIERDGQPAHRGPIGRRARGRVGGGELGDVVRTSHGDA